MTWLRRGSAPKFALAATTPRRRCRLDLFGHGPIEDGHLRPRQRAISWTPRRAVDHDESTDAIGDDVGPFDRQPEGHRPAHRVTNDDCFAKVEPVQHCGDIVNQPAEAERRRHRRGAAEAAMVDGDHAADRPPPAVRPAGQRPAGRHRTRGAGAPVSRHRTPRRAASRRRRCRWHGSVCSGRRGHRPNRGPSWRRARR